MQAPGVISKTVCMASFFFLITVSLSAASTSKNTEVDLIAKVNDTPISRKDFDRSLAVANKQFEKIGSAQEEEKIVKQEVLDRLIDLELMYQDSIKRGIIVADSLVEENYRGFLKQFEKEDDFLSFLKEKDMTESDLRKDVQRQIAMRQLQVALQKELRAGITISDKETADFYQNNLDRFKQPEQVRASHILIKVQHDADAATAKKALEEIEQLRVDIQGGADFAEIARSHSQGPSNTKGGDLGFFARGSMVKPFEDAAFNLKPGGLSEVVETMYGYHLILVTEQKAERTAPLDETKESIVRFLSQTELDKAQKEYIKGLRNKAKIVILEKF